MRPVIYVVSTLVVIALGFWAYQENYRTQAAIRDLRDLVQQIGGAHARIKTLNAEWAYLNRPDRLRDLAMLNFDRLGLIPLPPGAFNSVDRVSYPFPDLLPLGEIIDPVDTSFTAIPGEDPL